MALDWPNERYVRVYVRETPDQAAWSWQARALWPWLIVKADAAGVIETNRGARGVAALVRLPIEMVEPGLAELVEDGCIAVTERGYFMRNYIEAQTARSSTNQRQARHRDRDRAVKAASHTVSRAVTPSHTPSHAVTKQQAPVTPSRAEPSVAEHSQSSREPAATGEAPPEPKPTEPAKAKRPAPDGYREVIDTFHKGYAEQTGGKKPTWGAKQGAIVKRILDRHGRAETLERLPRLRSLTFPPPPHSIEDFERWFDKLAPVNGDARAGPSVGRAPPAHSHGTEAIDPRTIVPRKPS